MSRAERRRRLRTGRIEAKRSDARTKREQLARQRIAAHDAFLVKHGLKLSTREKTFLGLEFLWVLFGGPLVQIYYLWFWKPEGRFKKYRARS